ncbi:ECF RNA polymerase sigma factor SigK [Nymphon striatum]|nr:ECF RNA polymerase sigma factor SigK [Nymphon striatum]
MSSLPQENLESLLAHVAMGDRASFEVLFDKTSAKLFGVCLRILNDESQAQDALQEAYARIWDKAEAYRVNGFAPMTWLVTVARNIAIDRRRARPKDAQGLYAADVIPDAGLDPDAQSIAQSDAPRIQTCLAALPDGQATLIRRAYLDGDSYADLAATTDAPLDTIRTGLRRSLSALMECLSQNDSRPEQEDEALAAEYVLGLLGADEVKAFDKRLRDDPALRDILAGMGRPVRAAVRGTATSRPQPRTAPTCSG